MTSRFQVVKATDTSKKEEEDQSQFYVYLTTEVASLAYTKVKGWLHL